MILPRVLRTLTPWLVGPLRITWSLPLYKQKIKLSVSQLCISSKYLASHGEIPSAKTTYDWAHNRGDDTVIYQLLYKMLIIPAILAQFKLINDGSYHLCGVPDRIVYFVLLLLFLFTELRKVYRRTTQVNFIYTFFPKEITLVFNNTFTGKSTVQTSSLYPRYFSFRIPNTLSQLLPPKKSRCGLLL